MHGQQNVKSCFTSCYVTVYRSYCNLCGMQLSDRNVQGVEVCYVTTR